MVKQVTQNSNYLVKILGLAKNGREYFSQAWKQLRSKQICSTEESNNSRNFFPYCDAEVNVLP